MASCSCNGVCGAANDGLGADPFNVSSARRSTFPVRVSGKRDNAIGFTALGDTEACHEVAASGRFASAQVYHNLLNPSAGRAMPDAWSGQDFRQLLATCRKHNVATMNIRVLAAGVIATDERHGREGAITSDTELHREEARARAVFAKLGDRYGTRAQTALRFALANPDLSCVVVGLATLDHLDQALAAAEMGPLPATGLAALNEVYAAGFGI